MNGRRNSSICSGVPYRCTSSAYKQLCIDAMIPTLAQLRDSSSKTTQAESRSYPAPPYDSLMQMPIHPLRDTFPISSRGKLQCHHDESQLSINSRQLNGAYVASRSFSEAVGANSRSANSLLVRFNAFVRSLRLNSVECWRCCAPAKITKSIPKCSISLPCSHLST